MLDMLLPVGVRVADVSNRCPVVVSTRERARALTTQPPREKERGPGEPLATNGASHVMPGRAGAGEACAPAAGVVV